MKTNYSAAICIAKASLSSICLSAILIVCLSVFFLDFPSVAIHYTFLIHSASISLFYLRIFFGGVG